ncbi:MAG: hemolysin family protein [Candidatus Nitrosoabyssus spongiisocia]|nr:MAG: hemolysin family protein [Nitrosopumilaceae archaeon AB1(1)]
MVDLWISLVSLTILIGLSGFFSGLEVALVGIHKSKVLQLYKDKVKGSKALYHLKSNPGWMMTSVNLGNNLVNVASAALATSVAIELFGNDGLGIVIGMMTFLILVFGEITPKTYCNANATRIALRFSPVLLIFSYSLYPIVKLFEVITRGVVRLTGSNYLPPPLTEDEIKDVVDQGLEENVIEEHERELVHGALNFDEVVIRAVMTPRTKMFTLPSKMLLFEALSEINKQGFSRIPIHGKTQDEIIGIVHVRDVLKLLEHDDNMKDLESISRKPIFVSQEKMLSNLFREMQGRQSHMAIVLDEFGGVEGLVTLEDLLEEIVGDIEDESDAKRDLQFQTLDKNTIIVNGDVELDVINEFFKSNIPKGDDYSTLNGLLHEKLHDIPQEGNKVEINSLKIIVEKVENNRTEQIRIERVN